MQIIGVSTDGIEANAKFAQEQGFQYPLLCDTQKDICLAYGSVEEKSASAAKRISYVIGPDGKVLQVYATVVAREHPETLLATL